MSTPSIFNSQSKNDGNIGGNNNGKKRPVRSKFLQNVLITYNSSPSPSSSPSLSAGSISGSDDEETIKNDKNNSTTSSTSDVNTNNKSKKKKRFRRSYNCGPCKKHKIKCDMKLPCGSCTKYGREDFCLQQPPNPPTQEQMLVKQERRRKYIQKRVSANSLDVRRPSVVSSVSNSTHSPPTVSNTEGSISLNNQGFNSQQQFFPPPNLYPQNYVPIPSNDHFHPQIQNDFSQFVHPSLNNLNINQTFVNPFSYPPNLPYNNDLLVQNQNGFPFIPQQQRHPQLQQQQLLLQQQQLQLQQLQQQQFVAYPFSPPQQQFWLLNPNIARNSVDGTIPSNKNRFYYSQYPNTSQLPVYQANSGNGFTIPSSASNSNPGTMLQNLNNIESDSFQSFHPNPNIQPLPKPVNKNKSPSN